MRSCPCIEKFIWNFDTKACEIDCTTVANASKWASVNSTVCQCQQGFNWINENFTCQIDCSKIWDATRRVDDFTCTCNNDKTFNRTQLTCDLLTEAPFFSSIWVIVGFVLCAIIILSMVIVLGKFCWQFGTKDNK